MIASVCPACFAPKSCRKPTCAFKGQDWRAPLVSFDQAMAFHLPSTATVVRSTGEMDDPFQGGDYDRGWDLEVEVF